MHQCRSAHALVVFVACACAWAYAFAMHTGTGTGAGTTAAAVNPPIMIAFHWHLHQPIYWPYENVVDTIAADRFPYSLLQIFTDRSGPYGGWPVDAVRSAQSGGLGHCGAQISFSGALQENLNDLAAGGLAFQGWASYWRQYVSALNTTAGHPALYLSAFGYHHPLMPLSGDERASQLITMQINLHRLMTERTFGIRSNDGLFPPENSFSPRMIPALVRAGIRWVLIDNIHFDRAHVEYAVNGFSYGENLYPSNPSDQRNNQSTAWYQLNDVWAPSKVSAPFGYRPYWIVYTDPRTGQQSRIIGVPGARYEGVEDGRGGFGALDYEQVMSQYAAANTDPSRPMLVLLAHDGDNYGGGTDAYYHNNFQNFVAWAQQQQPQTGTGAFECTTVEDYLSLYPPADDDVIHVEDGSWSGANNGDPTFAKWEQKFFDPQYEPNRNAWACMTAGINRMLTADAIAPYQSLANVLDGSGSATEKAWHYVLCTQASDYWYWPGADGGIWDSNPPRGLNDAYAFIDPIIAAAGPAADVVGPTVFYPYRSPWNPGAFDWNPNVRNPSTFMVWTLVYDVSGLTSVQLKYRVTQGVKSPAAANLVFDGGEWTSVTMVDVPLSGPLAPITDPLPLYIADMYQANVTGVSMALVDYYVVATDARGNTATSELFHVWVDRPNPSPN